MKKLLQKTISLFLSALMILTVAPAFALAAENDVAIPEIIIEKTSETQTELVLTVKIGNSLLNCLDMQIASSESLELTAIDILCNGLSSFNVDNGKISITNSDGIVAPADVAVYTFEKRSTAGVEADDITVTILTCYIEADDPEDTGTDVTDETVVVNTLPEEHTHVPGTEWNETKAPTCGEVGTEVLYCTECGEIADSRDVPTTEHVNTTVETTEPTCTEDGVEKVYCNDCKKYVSEKTLEKTGHVDTHVEEKAPTCTESGYRKVVCACGEIVEEETLKPTDHVGVTSEIKLPTCTEDGYEKTVCDCGEVVSYTVLEKTGHLWIDDVKTPTCTEDGYIRKYCPACKAVEGTQTLTKSGHSWSDWSTVKAPTYSATGIERRICGGCGIDEERSVPKLVAEVSQLVLDTTETTMNFRGTLRLFLSVLPEEAAYSADIVWSSSDENVATVNENGEVYAANLGTATITASTADGSIVATCEVTVKYSFLQWIIVYILFGWIWYI